jgi:hypothetical protein
MGSGRHQRLWGLALVVAPPCVGLTGYLPCVLVREDEVARTWNQGEKAAQPTIQNDEGVGEASARKLVRLLRLSSIHTEQGAHLQRLGLKDRSSRKLIIFKLSLLGMTAAVTVSCACSIHRISTHVLK